MDNDEFPDRTAAERIVKCADCHYRWTLKERREAERRGLVHRCDPRRLQIVEESRKRHDPEPMCDCDAGMKCPLGKVGSALRCSLRELDEAGVRPPPVPPWRQESSSVRQRMKEERAPFHRSDCGCYICDAAREEKKQRTDYPRVEMLSDIDKSALLNLLLDHLDLRVVRETFRGYGHGESSHITLEKKPGEKE